MLSNHNGGIKMAYALIALTILFTVYGQVMLKWQVAQFQPAPLRMSDPSSIARMLMNPWVLSAFAAAFLASLCWMATLTKLPLSKAYPFMALSFPTVSLLAVLLFKEEMNGIKITGTALITLGAIVLSRSPN